jgi:hypothetical protein
MSTDTKSRSGYKSPPAEHRFQKGQSGNPQGRPRKAAPAATIPDSFQTDLDAMALRIANRPATIRDGDKTETVSTMEVVLRAEAAQAARGKRLDKKDMLERHALTLAKVQAAKREDYEDWARIKAFKLAERKTVAEAHWKHQLLHPDDIILGPDFEVSIIGPLNAAELANVETSCRYRDLMIMQSVLDCQCRAKSKVHRDRKDILPLSTVLAFWIDRHVFRRFRLGHVEIGRAMDQHLWKPRGDLEDEIRSARQALGVDVGGRIGPMPHVTIAQAKKMFRQRPS